MILKRWIDFAYWAIVVMTFAAISGLGFLATQTLREQASENTRKEYAETLVRLKQQGRTFFEDLPQNLRSEPVLEFPSPPISLPVLPIPTSSDSLVFFASLAQPSSFSRALLLEALLNADLDHKPFWYLNLLKNTWQTGDLEALHRYCSRIQGWPMDFDALSGVSMKTLGALYDAEAFMQEGRPELAITAIQRIAFLPAPRIVLANAVFKSSPWIKIKNLPLQQILLWAWGHLEMNSGDSRFFFADSPEKPVSFSKSQGIESIPEHIIPIFMEKRGSKHFLYNAKPILVQVHGILQNAAGTGMKVTLELQPEQGAQVIPLAAGLGFTLAVEGQTHSEPGFPSRLLVGFLISLGLFGLATMTLFHLKRRQEAMVQEEKEWLFRQAAHDLKTPLTTIRALAETLSLGRIQSTEQGFQYLEKILHECDYSAELIDALLLAARLRTGAIQIAPEEISVLPQVKHLLERFSPRLEGWTITLEIPPSMTICADPQLFQRVMMNLLENVVRHAGSGKALSIDYHLAGECSVALRLCDRGPGFSSVRSRGTEDDPAAGTHTRSAGGLGLSLIRRIMDLHGGSLKTESRPGGGSLVTTTWKLLHKG
ncbi:MAG: HAMP domain-containing sensor histidine kinase [Candidatus Ozemobacteraceae bacterium]